MRSAAVCVVRVPEDVTDPQQLAQLLSYDMKEGAGSRRIPFAALDAFRQESAMENALRQAVEENRLRVWYQPIWSASQKRTVAAEALLRVDDPTLIELSPEVFIPIAERSGLIREIGLFVFEESCRFLRDSAQYTPKLEFVELNLSVYQFLYDDLPARFEEIRSRYGVEASRINLELTETASERGSVVVSESMKRLRALGYSFSLDDFGTGFSNLQRLVKGGYANIKIDKSLLWDAGESDASARLLDSLIRAIHRFDVQVIQEGVETQEQLQRVIGAGCDLIQGFLFSRPVPEAEFLQYLTSESAH